MGKSIISTLGESLAQGFSKYAERRRVYVSKGIHMNVRPTKIERAVGKAGRVGVYGGIGTAIAAKSRRIKALGLGVAGAGAAANYGARLHHARASKNIKKGFGKAFALHKKQTAKAKKK